MDKVKLTNSLVKALEPRAKYFDTHDSEVVGLLVRTQPSGAKTFYVRYGLPDGTRRAFRIGAAENLTCDQARAAARLHWANATRGDDPMEAKQRPEIPTLKGFLDKSYSPRATHRTAQANVERVKYAFADLLEKPLDEIRPMWVENWKATRLADGLAKATINRDLDCLRGVLSRAVDWEVLREHPLKRVKRFKLDTGGKPRYLSPEEEKALYQALEAREETIRAGRDSANEWRKERGYREFPSLRSVPFVDHLYPMTVLALNTGLRRGEIFNLTWEDVHLSGDAPHVTVHGATAKSGKTRHVPLNRVALDALTRWKGQGEGIGLVFRSPRTGGRFDHIRRSWGELTKLAGLANFRFHDCRHHFASMLVQRGVDLNTVREILGHADIKMTLRYGHLAPGNAARAVALLEPVTNISELKRSEAK